MVSLMISDLVVLKNYFLVWAVLSLSPEPKTRLLKSMYSPFCFII